MRIPQGVLQAMRATRVEGAWRRRERETEPEPITTTEHGPKAAGHSLTHRCSSANPLSSRMCSMQKNRLPETARAMEAGLRIGNYCR